MRDDMFKVIVERPRQGVGYYRDLHNEYRAAKRFKLDDDGEVNDEFTNRVQPMRARSLGWDRKTLNENLNPLRRYFESQVGRLWNDVYSDVCSKLDTNSTVKQHVRDHIKDFVEIDTYRTDGVVYSSNKNYTLGQYGVSGLYVDPDTGVLCTTGPRKSHHYTYERKQLGHLRVSPMLSYVWIKGVWYRIDLISEESLKQIYAKLKTNSFLIKHYNYWKMYSTSAAIKVPGDWYFHDGYYPVKRSTASKKELKKYGLKS